MSPSVSDNVLADRYQLIEPIGIGGMAEVHRAWDTVLRRHVAIKVFQPGFDPAAAQRFDNEVRVLAGLSHPALVSVYDADTKADTPFVVLRLIEGRTLHDRLVLGSLPLDDARRLGARLADALAHVHAHDLVHRDVKPANILLDREDDAYLADFGLAHLTGATRLTRTNQLVGTAAYLAPEQVLGQDIGTPTDVYALGLVLLECLTGRREYTGSEVEAAVARLHRPPAIPDDLPADVRALLARMTAAAPDERPTAHDCARALLGASLPAAASLPEADTEELPRSVGRPVWKALVASAGALIGAFAITMAAMSGDDPTTSVPPGSTQQAPPEQAAASDAPRDQAEPRFIRTPQDQGGTTSAPTRATTSADAVEPAVEEGREPVAGTTTAPAATTTARPTTEAPTTPVETSTPAPEPEPSAQPTEGAQPTEDAQPSDEDRDPVDD
ncbi:serine/threonine protein kinase [Saccharothrix saharensis]|uniref:non-specific serine/threonine protein kinase n=1 Tax=Saccharothrix saharensis TaxID=571190 RepID=A0A543J7U0_9PSEU|nr:serine/threonine-protein kinase [Saccharothrix saharensis]TQM78895.1 serine/threonine protein kinase [Saccharothrix saharensis]